MHGATVSLLGGGFMAVGIWGGVDMGEEDIGEEEEVSSKMLSTFKLVD